MTGKKYVVYCHTAPSNKKYIGITCQKPTHRWMAGKRYSQSPAFYHAIEKYGWENIKHDILYRGLSEEEAKNKEKELIALYQTQDRKHGYNLTAGGDGMSNPSPETRARLSASRKGKQPTLGYRHTEEAKKKISEALKGNKWNVGRTASEEARKKLSQKSKGNKYNLGKKATEETRKKLSEAHKGKIFTDEEKRKIGVANSEAVNQYKLNGDYIKTHISANDAARELTGNTKSHIAACCLGQRLSWHNYQWRHDTIDNRTNIGAVDISVKSGERHPRSRPINQFSIDGELITTFCNAPAGASAVGGWPQNIVKCCQEQINTAYGYIWRYAE